RFTSGQDFNKVLVHYDKAPITGGDWGPIFMADSMRITAVPPIVLQATFLANGSFQLVFTNAPGSTSTVLSWRTRGFQSQAGPRLGRRRRSHPVSISSPIHRR